MFVVEEKRIANVELEHKHNYGEQSFGIMMYVTKEMRSITSKYENENLTDEDLENHYEILNDYILSIYNQQPFPFISNIRNLRFTDKLDAASFNEDAYNKYMDIINYFDYTYHQVENNYTDDEFLDFYYTFESDEFNNKLEILIKALISE